MSFDVIPSDGDGWTEFAAGMVSEGHGVISHCDGGEFYDRIAAFVAFFGIGDIGGCRYR